MARESRKRLIDATVTGSGLTVLEGIAAAIPIVGGPLAVTLNHIRVSRDHRLVDFVVALEADLLGLGTRLDVEFVKSAEFAGRAEAVFEEVVRAGQNAKHKYYRTALAKGASRQRPGTDEWQLYLDVINRVQLPHLRLLAGLAAAPRSPEANNAQALWAHVQGVAPGMADLMIARCWDELANLGILVSRNLVTEPVPPGTEDDDPVFTRFGRTFVVFLDAPRLVKKRTARQKKSKPD